MRFNFNKKHRVLIQMKSIMLNDNIIKPLSRFVVKIQKVKNIFFGSLRSIQILLKNCHLYFYKRSVFSEYFEPYIDYCQHKAENITNTNDIKSPEILMSRL